MTNGELALTVGIINLVTLIGYYTKSYFTEKGKNAALKQDLKELTTIVEQIKGQLSISTSGKISLNQEEKESLIALYEKFAYWRLILQENDFRNKGIPEVQKMAADARAAHLDFYLALARYRLYHTNKDLDKILEEWISQTFTFHQRLLSDCEHMEIHIRGINEAYILNKDHNKRIDINQLLKFENETLNEFYNFKKERIPLILKQEKLFIDSTNAYIKTLGNRE
ncbi:MAG: hypothetical protein K0S44_115 [Bacteroidetes bacterium]|jgi:hypothetical protein|nr:hypothetical protein [Bacteroidota bacterium]